MNKKTLIIPLLLMSSSVMAFPYGDGDTYGDGSMQVASQRALLVQKAPPQTGADPCAEVASNAKVNADQAAIKAETIAESVVGELDLSSIRSCSKIINALTPPSVKGFLASIGIGGQILTNLFNSAACSVESMKKVSALGSTVYNIGSGAVNTYDAYNSGDLMGVIRSGSGVINSTSSGTISSRTVSAAQTGAHVVSDLYTYSTNQAQ